MRTIFPLSPHLISQIAAGEIIERPAYAVKELIENSIDAHATDIRIDITDYGMQTIIVSDNGIGMSTEDIQECYKLHTTSKQSDQETFLSVRTLGFRGEALASIAAVSSLVIESKTADSMSGTKIHIERGNISTERIGMPNGTRVLVNRLFEHTPVRSYALSHKRTEIKKITDIITHYAIIYPEIFFSLSHDGRSLLHFPQTTQEKRIQQLLHTSGASHLIPFTFEAPHIQMNGYISTPQMNFYHQFQYISVNKRPVVNKLLSASIKNGYGILLQPHLQPSCILSVSVSPEIVNVNIHPRKEDVRLLNDEQIYTNVTEKIQETLQSQDIHFEGFTTIHDQTNHPTYTTFADELRHTVLPQKTMTLGGRDSLSSYIQIHSVYILTETSKGLCIIDQHAAHERILYEAYLTAYKEQKKHMSALPVEEIVIIDISPIEQELFSTYLPALEEIGITMRKLHPLSYQVVSLSPLFHGRNIKSQIYDYIHELETHVFTPEIDSHSKKMLAFLACRSAVKAGDTLTTQQMQAIVQDLEKLPTAVTCPHGRPTAYYISIKELHKMFKRL